MIGSPDWLCNEPLGLQLSIHLPLSNIMLPWPLNVPHVPHLVGSQRLPEGLCKDFIIPGRCHTGVGLMEVSLASKSVKRWVENIVRLQTLLLPFIMMLLLILLSLENLSVDSESENLTSKRSHISSPRCIMPTESVEKYACISHQLFNNFDEGMHAINSD